MSSEEQSVDKVVAEVVVDVNKDGDLVQGWYDEARDCRTPESLQKLSERVLSVSKMTDATTPHAYASIALAGLKIGLSSTHGALTKKQWTEVKDLFLAAIEDAATRSED